ncbi:cyclic pyranopterin monophosphate synthase MoaC [Nitrospina gracilis]|uniref:cyclic pyranopterin monophosphate synthase MoaC n=1 Tax=Nitrospina gracilis TaxID=35801 RepID=UPI001F0171D3|nr:cyclic pyranopterin monophosphate synthase MoaC [Nitrospina gracilis]MCF8720752.1 cyclic pyranopterin phosphate synthase [Nitrospina gracilis Nb-211]
MNNPLTHFNEEGRARMVDVSEKQVTERVATAQGTVFMRPETLRLIQEGRIKKGDVLAVAQVAGIQGAKKTSDVIPMCHPLMLNGVDIQFREQPEPDANGLCSIHITATVKVSGKTGVEMEALTAVSMAALTIYDMCKAVDRDMFFNEIGLTYKAGGKSGTFTREQVSEA